MAKANQQAQSKPAQPSAQAPVATNAVSVEAPKMDGVTAENFSTHTAEQLITGFGSKSNAIRGLHALGLKPGPISKSLGIRYQHARNVLSRPLKRVIKEQRDAGNTTQSQS